jgi:hypothetical protein
MYTIDFQLDNKIRISFRGPNVTDNSQLTWNERMRYSLTILRGTAIGSDLTIFYIGLVWWNLSKSHKPRQILTLSIIQEIAVQCWARLVLYVRLVINPPTTREGWLPTPSVISFLSIISISASVNLPSIQFRIFWWTNYEITTCSWWIQPWSRLLRFLTFGLC